MTTSLVAANTARWKAVRINSAKQAEFNSVAKRLAAPKAKVIYQDIEKATGVPWFVIAVIHEREASQRWDRSIAQGDPFNAPSRHIPKGRGPFASFKDAAVDALMKCAPFAGKWTDWSPGGTMTLLEHYNGLGYANGPFDRAANRKYPPQASPYIWAGTNQYSKGKYVADGRFDPNTVDSQLGCAGLLLAMQQIDNSISFGAKPAAFADVDGTDSAAIAPDDDNAGGGDAPSSSGQRSDPELLAAQQSLKGMNYNPGVPTGYWGGMTAGALSGFLNDRGSSIAAPTSEGAFDSARDDIAAEIALAESEGFKRPVSAERASGDKKVVAQVAPEVVPAHRNFLAAAWTSAATFFAAVYDTVSDYISEAWDFFTDHKDDLPSEDSGLMTTFWEYVHKVPVSVWLLLVGGILLFIAINARAGVKKITESVQTGQRQ